MAPELRTSDPSRTYSSGLGGDIDTTLPILCERAAQQPAHAPKYAAKPEPSIAWPGSCSGWLCGLPVQRVAIVLGPIIEPHMQPRDAGPSSAEPHGLGAEPTLHRRPDQLPQCTSLQLGRLADECPKVAVGGMRAARARHHHYRVFAQVRELEHSSFGRTAEVFCECVRIRFPCQPWAIQQDELEWPVRRRSCNWRGLPPERGKRRVSQQTDKPGAEVRISLPSMDNFRVR